MKKNFKNWKMVKQKNKKTSRFIFFVKNIVKTAIFKKKLNKFKNLHKKVQKLRKKEKWKKNNTSCIFPLKLYVKNDIFERKIFLKKILFFKKIIKLNILHE